MARILCCDGNCVWNTPQKCVLVLVSPTQTFAIGHWLPAYTQAWHIKSKGRFWHWPWTWWFVYACHGQKNRQPSRALRNFTTKVKSHGSGVDEVEYGECPEPVKLPWATGYELPVWIGAYGPKALAAAGEVGDGLILQIGDPALVKWFRRSSGCRGWSCGSWYV